jgi:hypothetical protein
VDTIAAGGYVHAGRDRHGCASTHASTNVDTASNSIADGYAYLCAADSRSADRCPHPSADGGPDRCAADRNCLCRADADMDAIADARCNYRD